MRRSSTQEERNMWTLLHEGGWPAWFTLIFAILSLAGAGRFAYTAKRKHLGLVYGLRAACLCSSLNGVVADIAAVGHHMNQRWEELSPHFTQALLQGIAES